MGATSTTDPVARLSVTLVGEGESLLRLQRRLRCAAKVSGFRAICKTHERRSTAPHRSISALEFRFMEPPCSSFHPKNDLNVGLPLIHTEFSNWLFSPRITLSNDIAAFGFIIGDTPALLYNQQLIFRGLPRTEAIELWLKHLNTKQGAT